MYHLVEVRVELALSFTWDNFFIVKAGLLTVLYYMYLKLAVAFSGNDQWPPQIASRIPEECMYGTVQFTSVGHTDRLSFFRAFLRS